MENLASEKEDKDMFWKVGMILSSFFLARVLAMVLAGVLVVYFFASRSNVPGLDGIEGTYLWYVWMLGVLVAELVGLRYGIRYVAQKASIMKNDVPKIIAWFVLFNVLLQLIATSRSSGVLSVALSVAFLIIECFAIKFFLQKIIDTQRLQ